MFGVPPLPRKLSAALRDLAHDRADVRRAALRDIGKLGLSDGGEQVLCALVHTLRKDPSAEVRAEAALVLADSGARGQIAPLLEAAEDSHERVRQMALIALGELGERGEPRILELLERMGKDKSAAIRFQALIALHHLAGPNATDAIIQATRDGDPEVRHIAFRIAEERHASDVNSFEAPSVLLLRARAALRDDSLAVRLSAAILLARCGDRAGTEVIAAAVNKHRFTVNLEDEQAAVELAGELGLEQARPGLRRRGFGLLGLARGPFTWQARVALARLGDAQAKSAILRGLSAWTRDARTIAVAAAGRARMGEALPIIAQMVDHPERADPQTVAEALAELREAL